LTASPPLALIQPEIVDLILSEAFELLKKTGIRVGSDEALELLGDSGVIVDPERRIARIPDSLVQKSLESAPKHLASRFGQPCVYGESNVHFDPGSRSSHTDPNTGEHRVALTGDLLTLVRVAEVLPNTTPNLLRLFVRCLRH
jgi:trimethylamine:corrinoid methyltransferase-like protein